MSHSSFETAWRYSTTTCPQCGWFVGWPGVACVCPICGLGLPNDLETDWERHHNEYAGKRE